MCTLHLHARCVVGVLGRSDAGHANKSSAATHPAQTPPQKAAVSILSGKRETPASYPPILFTLPHHLFLTSFSLAASGQVGTGTFRYGNIYWTSQGNTVNFFVEIAMRRSQEGWSYQGTSPDGYAREGDIVVLSARETPQFFYGDNQVERVLRMTVESSSVVEDWIRGTLKLPPHTYATPNNNGLPWRATFTGCCRLTGLRNNAGLDFTLLADVDLNKAMSSPRPASMPIQSVPYHSVQMPRPTLYVPVTDTMPSVQWALGTPAIIGGAARLGANQSSYLSVPLRPLHDMGEAACLLQSSSGACLYSLVSQSPNVRGLTVEGWIRADTASGGFLLSTGATPGVATCPYSGDDAARRCNVAAIFIKVNATSVAVGHEYESTSAPPSLVREEASFEVCSSPELCNSLMTYDALGQGTMTGKWVHIAVARRPAPAGAVTCANSSQVTFEYVVYVNGVSLGVSRAMCGAVPSVGFASDASLLFGADGGNKTSFLEGAMTEVRFWHGVRSTPQILDKMLQRMTPLDSDDPTLGTVTASTFGSVNSLIALYDFTAPCVQQSAGCPITNAILPIYPAAAAAKAMMPATPRGAVTTADTDSSGNMFWRTATDMAAGIDPFGKITLNPTNGPGFYQVTVYISRGGAVARVPVDFIVNVVDAAWDETRGAWGLCPGGADGCEYAGNQFMPSVRMEGDLLMSGECSALYKDQAFSAASTDIERFLYPCSIKAYAGFEVKLKAVGTDAQMTADAQGSTVDSPDVTNTQVGFRAGHAPDGFRFKVLHTVSPAIVDMSWTPCVVGGGGTVCVEAVDYHLNATRTGTFMSASSATVCTRLVVEEDPRPFFVASDSQVAPAVFTIGRTGTFILRAGDENCADSVDVIVSSNGEPLPPEARLDVVERSGPGGAGDGRSCVSTSARVTWMPSYKYGGYDREVCFTARDAVGECAKAAPHTSEHCVRVQVRRCVYAMHDDQQLQQVAGVFGLGWMHLWSLNQEILHPDFIPFRGQTVHVGHLMVMDSDKTMPTDLARRMGMPMDQLQFLNYGLDMSKPLRLGQEVCVVPDSCKGMTKTVMGTIEYAHEGSVQRGADAIQPLQPSLVNGEETSLSPSSISIFILAFFTFLSLSLSLSTHTQHS